MAEMLASRQAFQIGDVVIRRVVVFVVDMMMARDRAVMFCPDIAMQIRSPMAFALDVIPIRTLPPCDTIVSDRCHSKSPA